MLKSSFRLFGLINTRKCAFMSMLRNVAILPLSTTERRLLSTAMLSQSGVFRENQAVM
jgi:hypothetical protein